MLVIATLVIVFPPPVICPPKVKAFTVKVPVELRMVDSLNWKAPALYPRRRVPPKDISKVSAPLV